MKRLKGDRMSEKRFARGKGLFQDGFFTETINDKKTGERYYDGVKSNYQSSIEIVELLNALNDENEQLRQSITELERKVKKYVKIGEEQLKQIIELQDELNECRARPTLATDERGFEKEMAQ